MSEYDPLASYLRATQKDPTASLHEKHITWFLQVVTDWHVGRAQQEIEWAENNLANRWGTIKDPEGAPNLTLKGLNQMHLAEEHLGMDHPKNMVCVRAALEIVVKILAHREIDPDSHFANGPVLEMVRNALDALSWVPGETLTCGDPERKEVAS
jgi:hypothetical protein